MARRTENGSDAREGFPWNSDGRRLHLVQRLAALDGPEIHSHGDGLRSLDRDRRYGRLSSGNPDLRRSTGALEIPCGVFDPLWCDPSEIIALAFRKHGL